MTSRRHSRAPRRIARAAMLVLTAVACTCVSALARAQGAPDTAVTYFTRGPGVLSRFDLVPWLDVRGRYDSVTDRPGAPDFDRQRATLRTGLAWERPARPLRLEFGVRASIGSDHNRETWSLFDNEAADTIEVDRLGIRWASVGGEVLAAGKMRLPIPLTDMLWDEDLRPVGFAYTSRLGWTRVPGLSLGIGWFSRARVRDDATVSLTQLGFQGGNPASVGGEIRLSHFALFNSRELIEQRLTRQNQVVAMPQGPVFAESFKIVDLQLAGHVHAGRWPITARLDGAINSAAKTAERSALRIRLAAGGADAPYGIEAGWVHQRVEREAVVGAFNSDDWWFHSRARGQSAFLHVGLGRAVQLKVQGFSERRDDVTDQTRRLIAEVRWVWGDQGR